MESYINGHFVDYLAPKLPPSLIGVVLLWLFSWFRAYIPRGKAPKIPHFRWTQIFPLWLIVLSGWLVVRFGIVQWAPATLSWYANLVLGPYFFSQWILWYSRTYQNTHQNTYQNTQSHLISMKLLVKVAMGSIFLQALVASYQYITQKSLIGYMFLGEPSYSVSSHLAQSTWLPQAISLPYGTTPHPNILAGWMLLGLVLSLWWARFQGVFSKRNVWWWLVTPLYLLVLAGTESWTAISSWWLLLSIAYCHHFHRHFFNRVYGFFSSKIKLFFTGVIIQILWVFATFIPEVIGLTSLARQPSMARRTHLIAASQQLLEGNWWGTSLRSIFTHIYNHELIVWGGRFLQPVHNSTLFLIIILGVCTTFVLLLFMLNDQKKYSLIFLFIVSSLPIFSLDHYLVSTLSGQYLLFISYVFFIIYFECKYPYN